MRFACAAVALCLLFCAPAVAQVGNGLTLGETQTQTDAAPPPADTSTSGGGLKTWQEALIFAAGIILVTGIAFAILGDARERARRLDRHPSAPGAGAAGDRDRHATSQQAKQQARARARRARAARKRNR
jgi:hypothetical protein